MWSMSAIAQSPCGLHACGRVSHLHGDPPVDAVPQTDAGWRLHLVRRRPRRLVALAVGAHLQVLVHNIYRQTSKDKINEKTPAATTASLSSHTLTTPEAKD